MDTLLKPENKAMLTKLLTYHVVAGRMTAASIMRAIKAGHGSAAMVTVEGDPLTATAVGHKIYITDSKNDKALVTIPNVMQSNGVIHVIDHVLLPN